MVKACELFGKTNNGSGSGLGVTINVQQMMDGKIWKNFDGIPVEFMMVPGMTVRFIMLPVRNRWMNG